MEPPTTATPPDITMQEVLSGRDFPLTLRLGDLVKSAREWRQFVPTSDNGLTELVLGAGAGSRSGVLDSVLAVYTQGRIVRVEGTAFLIAYKREVNPEELEKIGRSDAPAPRLSADTVVNLTLLNVSGLKGLSNVRAFNAALVAPALSSAQKLAAQADEQSGANLSNLRQIGMALMQYTQDYDERMPIMNSATKAQIASDFFARGESRSVQERLYPYIKNKSVLSNPQTGELYKPNGILSGRNLQHIANRQSFVAFYDATPDASGKRAILFLDGHVQRISESAWPRLRAASRVTDNVSLPTSNAKIPLMGAAALFYIYKRSQSIPTGIDKNYAVYGISVRGRYFQSYNKRIYYRNLKTGAFQYVSPPTRPVFVTLAQAKSYGLSAYQGYNASSQGQAFGGYGNSKSSYTDVVPATP